MRRYRKQLPRGEQDLWVRTGGAVGDPSMAQLDAFNRDGAGVQVDERYCSGDPNEDLPVKRTPGSEA